ncbi:MAG: phage tail protein [Pseudomonadota bacterium]
MSANSKAIAQTAPYLSFRFHLKWDGRFVAGFTRVSSLSRSTKVVANRAGGEPATARRMPGQSEYEAITFERGMTHDSAFEEWANKVWDYPKTVNDEGSPSSKDEVSLEDFRRDMVLEVYNEAGQMVMAYNIYRCWVSEYQAMPELDAESEAVAIQSLVLQNEGWERDSSIKGPDAPDTLERRG